LENIKIEQAISLRGDFPTCNIFHFPTKIGAAQAPIFSARFIITPFFPPSAFSVSPAASLYQ